MVQKGGAFRFYADEGSLTSTDDKNQGYTHNYFLGYTGKQTIGETNK